VARFDDGRRALYGRALTLRSREGYNLETFSPWLAITGGLLIGAAATVLLLLSGRIAGVSGMLAASVRIAREGAPWNAAIAFVLGLSIGAVLISAFVREAQIVITSSVPLLVFGGLLVGFGTRLANGCTSGHGVCGVSRLSRRSLVATVTFMASAIATVFVMRHVVGA
jgi:uncharacterized protein